MVLDIPEGLTYEANSFKITDGLGNTLGYDSLSWAEVSKMLNGYASAGDYSSTSDTVLGTFKCTVNEGFKGSVSVGLKDLEFGSVETWEDHTADYQVVKATVSVASADPEPSGETPEDPVPGGDDPVTPGGDDPADPVTPSGDDDPSGQGQEEPGKQDEEPGQQTDPTPADNTVPSDQTPADNTVPSDKTPSGNTTPDDKTPEGNTVPDGEKNDENKGQNDPDGSKSDDPGKQGSEGQTEPQKTDKGGFPWWAAVIAAIVVIAAALIAIKRKNHKD